MNKIESAEIPWEDTVVMVCTKCAKQFHDSHSKGAPERIKSELKTKSKLESENQVRVITTSCLNICPVNKIAIAVASSKDPAVFKAFAVDADESLQELYKIIIQPFVR
jgi:predicted metal-binding protein